MCGFYWATLIALLFIVHWVIDLYSVSVDAVNAQAYNMAVSLV